LLAEHPVEEAQVAAGDVNAAGNVDSVVERELDSLDQVEGYGVFETAVQRNLNLSALCIRKDSGVLHQLEADVGQIEGLGGVGEEFNCRIHDFALSIDLRLSGKIEIEVQEGWWGRMHIEVVGLSVTS
jgi:hypothetical protein